jgi:hypothetical protein
MATIREGKDQDQVMTEIAEHIDNGLPALPTNKYDIKIRYTLELSCPDVEGESTEDAIETFKKEWAEDGSAILSETVHQGEVTIVSVDRQTQTERLDRNFIRSLLEPRKLT